jgi:hypothetical protein
VCRSPGHDRWDRCRARPAGVWSVAGRSATAPASPSTGHARRVTGMRSQHGGRLDSAHQLAQRTAQVAQATAEAEMVRYAGGVALLDAPHSTPTTYAAWLCAKKTRYQHDARGPAPRGNFLSTYPMRKSMFRKDRCAQVFGQPPKRVYQDEQWPLPKMPQSG